MAMLWVRMKRVIRDFDQGQNVMYGHTPKRAASGALQSTTKVGRSSTSGGSANAHEFASRG